MKTPLIESENDFNRFFNLQITKQILKKSLIHYNSIKYSAANYQ